MRLGDGYVYGEKEALILLIDIKSEGEAAYSELRKLLKKYEDNPDSNHPEYSTELGIYEEGCGLDKVTMSWGHDEYLYHVVKDYLPEPALYMIRYH